MSQRILYYTLLVLLTIAMPYLLTMVFIIITGDRVEGMKSAVIPGLISAHLVFGLIFIKRKWTIRVLLSVVVTAIITGAVILLALGDNISTNLDLYGFWDLVVINFICGIIVWEIFYRVNAHY